MEFRPTPDQFAWTFGGVAPTHRITPGTALRLWTEDAFSGRLQRTTDRPSEVLVMTEVNPQTGPVLRGGRRAGRHARASTSPTCGPARDWAASTTIPFFGALTGTDRTALLQEPLPERTWIYQLDRAAGTVLFEATNLSLDLPIAPMLGTVGVAPAGREVRTSLVPDTFGGNMDTPEMRAGTTCYLGVNVPGALFSVGDGHYRQGEGESCGTAVEGAMDVTLVVDLVKGGRAGVAAARARRRLAVVGSSRPLEDAWRASQVGMVAWLGELYGLDPLDAYQLLTQISRSPLANVVDANYCAVTKIEKALAARRARLRRDAPHLRSARSPERTPQMDLQLDGKVALVTGGTKGIGRASSRRSPPRAPRSRSARARGRRRHGEEELPRRRRTRRAAPRSTSPTATRSPPGSAAGRPARRDRRRRGQRVSALAIGADRGELGEELPGRPHAHRAAGRGRAPAPQATKGAIVAISWSPAARSTSPRTPTAR